MQAVSRCLIAALLLWQAAGLASAQQAMEFIALPAVDAAVAGPEYLPSPLEAMGSGDEKGAPSYVTPPQMAAPQSGPFLGGATASGAPPSAAGQVEAVPPGVAIENLPLSDIAPSAMRPFALQEGSARLIRGDEVVVLSNSALRNSGVFNMALQNSPTLAQSYHALQAQTLRIQETRFEMGQAQAAASTAFENGAQEAGALQARALGLNRAYNDLVYAQARAEAQFEMDLWNHGINGAKVGTISTTGQSASYAPAEPDRFVMVQAIGDNRQNNLGYSRTVVYRTGELGATTVPSEYLLPLPVEANDLFYNRSAANYVQRAPDGWMIPLTADPARNPVLQLLATPQGSIFYDTGDIDASIPLANNFAEQVSLQSRRDPDAGQSFLTGNEREFPLHPAIDIAASAQAMDVGGGNSLQLFTVANNDLRNEVFSVSSLGARLYNRSLGSFFEGWSLVAGQKQSIFGEIAATPSGANANRTLLGTVNRPDGIAQLGVDAPFSDSLMARLGIEDPDHNQTDAFYSTTTGVTKLNRYPSLATSLTLQDRAKLNRLQLGGLLRSNGYELNATSQELFATGWGLSAIAQFQRGNSMNYFGVTGGEGVGFYLEGIRYSVVADPTIASIESIAAYGAYAGRSMWFYDESNNPLAVINAAYGYALEENPGIATLDPNRKLHQAWINYTRFFGKNLGAGVEYHYGYREAVSGDVGEDHRAMFVVTVRSATTPKSTQVQNYAYAPTNPSPPRITTAEDDPELLPPVQTATPSFQLQAAGATVDGRPIEEVVRQSQRGGAAFQQGL